MKGVSVVMVFQFLTSEKKYYYFIFYYIVVWKFSQGRCDDFD